MVTIAGGIILAILALYAAGYVLYFIIALITREKPDATPPTRASSRGENPFHRYNDS